MLNNKHILLADDDKDDIVLFQDVLQEINLPVTLTTMKDGEQLISYLHETGKPTPDILFLDLNMPRKSGFQCLLELKTAEKLRSIPVIILTTSYQTEIVNLLYKKGAQYYIRKPNDFSLLKKLIQLAMELTLQPGVLQPPREEFVLSKKSVL